jgi:hypothetical protein
MGSANWRWHKSIYSHDNSYYNQNPPIPLQSQGTPSTFSPSLSINLSIFKEKRCYTLLLSTCERNAKEHGASERVICCARQSVQLDGFKIRKERKISDVHYILKVVEIGEHREELKRDTIYFASYRIFG